jgi:transposase
MYLTRAQFKRIRHLLPKPRSSKLISYYRFLNALAYMARNGCKWRALPSRFGPWHTVCMRLYRWAHNGALVQVLNHLQQQRLSQWAVLALSLDSTIAPMAAMSCVQWPRQEISYQLFQPTRNARILGYWISNGIANAMKSSGCFDESKRIGEF